MSKETAPSRYHPVHVALHWLMFLLVIMMLGIGKFVMPGVPVDDPQKPFMLQAHAYIGFFIAILLVARIILLFTTKRPAPADAGNAFLNFVARAVHVLFYVLLLGMVLSGMGLFQVAGLPGCVQRRRPLPGGFLCLPAAHRARIDLDTPASVDRPACWRGAVSPFHPQGQPALPHVVREKVKSEL